MPSNEILEVIPSKKDIGADFLAGRIERPTKSSCQGWVISYTDRFEKGDLAGAGVYRHRESKGIIVDLDHDNAGHADRCRGCRSANTRQQDIT